MLKRPPSESNNDYDLSFTKVNSFETLCGCYGDSFLGCLSIGSITKAVDGAVGAGGNYEISRT